MSGTTYADMIFKKDQVYAGHTATYNLAYGGMNGHLPRLGLVGPDGKTYAEWHANQAYLRQNVIPYVLKAPRFFDYLPEKEKWIKVYKNLIETVPLSIDGLDATITVETDSRPVGGGGQEQAEPTNVTRATSSPSFNYKEIAGKAINKFFETYIYMAFGDEYTKRPNVASYMSNLDEIGGIYGPEMYAGAVMFIEPDVTRMAVIESWLCFNFWPTGAGELIGKMDKTQGGQIVDISIPFQAITIRTEAVRRLADIILANLTVCDKMPDLDLLLPIDDTDPNISAIKDTGYNAR